MKGNESKTIKKPWPTKDAMEQMYTMNLWRGNRHDFYSGAWSLKVKQGMKPVELRSMHFFMKMIL